MLPVVAEKSSKGRPSELAYTLSKAGGHITVWMGIGGIPRLLMSAGAYSQSFTCTPATEYPSFGRGSLTLVIR